MLIVKYNSWVGLVCSWAIRGSNSGLGKRCFSSPNRPDQLWGPTQPPIQCVPSALSPGVKQPARDHPLVLPKLKMSTVLRYSHFTRERDRLSPVHTEVKNAWNFSLTFLIYIVMVRCIHGGIVWWQWAVRCVAPYHRFECLSAAGTWECRVPLLELLTAVPML